MLSVSVCLFYFNSADFFLSFIRSPYLSISLSPLLDHSLSAAVPVGGKLGECDRKREVAGREMKGCVEREEKRNGDNEKSDFGPEAAANLFHVRIHRYTASNTGSLGGPAENERDAGIKAAEYLK